MMILCWQLFAGTFETTDLLSFWGVLRPKSLLKRWQQHLEGWEQRRRNRKFGIILGFIWTDVYWVMVIHIYIIHMFLFDIFKHGKILQQISGGLQRLGPARSQRQLADTCCLPRLSIAFRTEMSMPLQAECWQLGCVDTCGITGICGRTSAISEYSYLFGSIYWE